MLRLGTRASTLATTQSAWVARHLVTGGEGEANGFELVHISTHGDRDRQSPLTQIGGTGVFVSAVREALLAGDVDVVVHSLKDLPTTPPDGIRLAAVPVREDPSDALITREGIGSLEEIPQGGTVGTGSPRRAAQLRLMRPDLDVRPIRGNIDTRMRYAESGEMDAVVLATSGLVRLGLAERIAQRFDPHAFLPAPAQGALAVEVREDFQEGAVETAGADGSLGSIAHSLSVLDDRETRAAAAAERAVLRALEAGCSAPVATFAEVGTSGLLTLKAGVYGRNSHIIREGAVSLDDAFTGNHEQSATQLGRDLAAEMLADGAKDLLAEEL